MSNRSPKIVNVLMLSAALTACGGGGGADETASNSPVSVLHAFSMQSGNWQPNTLVADPQGNLYGTTTQTGNGSVFEIDTRGNVSTLHQFNVTDGSQPTTLVVAADGTLYGVTENGGAFSWGTVYKLSVDGTFTTLHSFSGPDGFLPDNLIMGADGNLYGETSAGGPTFSSSMDRSLTGAGEVFKVTPTGEFSILYSFSGPDGYFAYTLLQGSDGNLYGSTAFGGPAYTGTASDQQGNGTIFKLSLQGNLTTLHAFGSLVGSANSLLEATDGNLYGTTPQGGTGLIGSVFRLTTSGEFTELHAFSGPDGMFANSLVQAPDGTLYGTALQGGSSYKAGSMSLGEGVIFRISTSQAFATLYSFADDVGATPFLTTPVSASKLYGIARQAGPDSGGIAFEFNPTTAGQ